MVYKANVVMFTVEFWFSRTGRTRCVETGANVDIIWVMVSASLFGGFHFDSVAVKTDAISRHRGTGYGS